MKTKFIFLYSLIVLLLSLSTISSQAQTIFFTPDGINFLISQFNLKNGEQIRGTVTRMVLNSYYEVRLSNGTIAIIREEDIATKMKVSPDMREKSFYYDFGIGGASMIRSNNDFTALFFQTGFGKDFGKEKKYFVNFELASGRTFWKSDDFEGEMLGSNISAKLGFGYNFNRTEKFSQSLSIGGATYLNDAFFDYFLYIQGDFPVKIGANALIAPYVTYFTPIEGFDYGNSMFLFGLRFRYYISSFSTSPF